MTTTEKHIIPYFKQPGTFIEIGCWDGEHKSQTAELEALGWTGVCADPFPVNFENRTAQVIKSAISKDGQPRVFVKVLIDRRDGGDVSYFSGFRDTLKDHWFLIEQYCDYELIEMPTVTFESIAPRNHINFLSIDTEGSEQEIIESIDFSRYSFDMIMFEHNSNSYKKWDIGSILVKAGYKLHESLLLDDIYVKA